MYQVTKTNLTQSPTRSFYGTRFITYWSLKKGSSNKPKKQDFNFSRLIGLSSRKRGTRIWLPAFAGIGSLGGERGAVPGTKSNYSGENITNHTLKHDLIYSLT